VASTLTRRLNAIATKLGMLGAVEDWQAWAQSAERAAERLLRLITGDEPDTGDEDGELSPQAAAFLAYIDQMPEPVEFVAPAAPIAAS
jgi:hypothetical protein